MTTPYYVGLMSGTSLDGLDIALCRFNSEGFVSVVHAQTVPLPPPLCQELSNLSQQNRLNEKHLLAVADRRFGLFCGKAVNAFLATHAIPRQRVVAIGSHGQTVQHSPDSDPAYTTQIGCPATIAATTGIDVVSNFRQKDVALGGQGAPLAPAFHQAIVTPSATVQGVLNIGGIANLTVLSATNDVTGFDTGPGNCLLDSWFNMHHPDSATHYDADGIFATQGDVLQELLVRLKQDPYFAKQGPKSSGREYFHLAWLHKHLRGNENPADVQRTLLELTACTIASQIQEHQVRQCYVCGGGVHNSLLYQRLEALVAAPDNGCTMARSSVLGVDPDWVEAAAFAWLAWCFMQQRPSSLASVTGASRNAILGGLFPAT